SDMVQTLCAHCTSSENDNTVSSTLIDPRETLGLVLLNAMRLQVGSAFCSLASATDLSTGADGGSSNIDGVMTRLIEEATSTCSSRRLHCRDLLGALCPNVGTSFPLKTVSCAGPTFVNIVDCLFSFRRGGELYFEEYL